MCNKNDNNQTSKKSNIGNTNIILTEPISKKDKPNNSSKISSKVLSDFNNKKNPRNDSGLSTVNFVSSDKLASKKSNFNKIFFKEVGKYKLNNEGKNISEILKTHCNNNNIILKEVKFNYYSLTIYCLN